MKKTLDGKIKAQSIIQNEQDLSEIAEKLDKFSNATIKDLANSAADLAKHENRRNITKEDFFNVIHNNQKRKISDENPYKMNEPRQMGFVLRK